MKSRQLCFLGTGIALLSWGLVWAAETADAREVIERAKLEARSIPRQALALADLVWPREGRPDPDVAPLARAELVEFGQHGIPALRATLRRVDPVWSADITAAVVEASLRVTEGVPIDFVPALEDALWHGSADAKRLAIPELARRRYASALMACADALFDHPEIAPIVIEALGDYGLDKARHTLATALDGSDPEQRALAAAALARIGGRSLETLRDASLSPRVEIRELAIETFLPISGPNDLTALYEYVARYPDDDPELREKVLLRATQLEALLEQQQAAEAATPDLEGY